jgi:hypothetical protein
MRCGVVVLTGPLYMTEHGERRWSDKGNNRWQWVALLHQFQGEEARRQESNGGSAHLGEVRTVVGG